MNTISIVLGVGLAVVVLMLATAWRRRAVDVDLGTVSHHWIAEHRMGQHDSQR